MPVFRQRRGTAAALAAANEVPAAGQIYFEIDTNRIKIGNGTLPYNSLAYIGGGTVAITDVTGLSAALSGKANTVHNHVLGDITNAGTAASRDVPISGNATVLQVVLGSDTRLTDERVPINGSVTDQKLSETLALDGGTY